MTAEVTNAFVGAFLVMCRVGIAFGTMPAMAGPRYPMMVRLLVALAVSVSIAPLIIGRGHWVVPPGSSLIGLIITECAVGFVIGFWGYCFMHAVRFAAAYIVGAVGLGGIPGQALHDNEGDSTLGNMLSLAFTALLLATDLHFTTIQALVSSYDTIGLGGVIDMPWSMVRTLQILERTSAVALQMCSPFMVLSVVINFALGVANRMAPQLSVYFAFTGLLTIVALFALMAASPAMLAIAADAYRNFLETGFRP